MGNTYEKKFAVDGGFDAEFEDPLPEELTCCICFLAFRDPMQLSCGHQYCRSCLNKCSRKQGREFACPVDRHLVDVDKIFADKALERKVLSLAVKCGNAENGCGWSGELRSLDKHTQECIYVFMDCTLCPAQILKMHFDEHVLHQCGHRVLSCGLCKVDYLFKDEGDHNQTCKHWPVDCVNSCGEEIPRNKMDAHLLECSFSTSLDSNLRCSFEGASNQDDSSNLSEHDQLKYAMDKIHVLQKEVVLMKEKSVNLESEFTVQKILLETHMKKSLKKEIDMQHRIEILEKALRKITPSLANTLNIQEEKPGESIPSHYSAEACSTQGSSSTNTEKYIPSVYMSCERLTSITDTFRQMQESKYGIFVWKVDRYKQQLVEAQHTHSCIYSEPFFTSEFGYKLRLQAWLNGNGVGKDMCISLYAQIMKGPYDDDLVWPFSLKTSLLILNQLDKGKHRERSNNPSEAGNEMKQMYFGRPMSPVNVGYGCGTALITHKNVINNGFAVDGCIYFMCRIDT